MDFRSSDPDFLSHGLENHYTESLANKTAKKYTFDDFSQFKKKLRSFLSNFETISCSYFKTKEKDPTKLKKLDQDFQTLKQTVSEYCN